MFDDDMRDEWFSFDGPRKSDEGSDANLTYNFCWHYLTTLTNHNE